MAPAITATSKSLQGTHCSAPKKTREGTSRARTGCTTCKKRRIKCDEGRPSCRRCAVSSRNCEYDHAISAPAITNQHVIVYLPPTSQISGPYSHDRELDFYHHNIARTLDGQFDSNFWSRLVLQLSYSEPSIRHAIVAASLVYQDVQASSRHPAGYVRANIRSQEQWSMAVKSLSSRMQAHPCSKLVPLVCCLIFTCIDFLKGNLEVSMIHIENGFEILASLQNDDRTASRRDDDHSLDAVQALQENIVPMFSRLKVLCSLAGKTMPRITAVSSQEHRAHENTTDSRRLLFEISEDCLQFIHDADSRAHTLSVTLDDLCEQMKLQTRLDARFRHLQELFRNMRAGEVPINAGEANLLLIHYKVIYIWIRVCTDAEESATDLYQKDFEDIVDYAEQIVKSDVRMEQPEPLSFDLHITGPLYYSAMKCRHPSIRRRALKLLQFAPRREGLWNAHHAYVTAEKVIEFEERYLNGRSLPHETSRVHGLHLPDDDSRIWYPAEQPLELQLLAGSIVPSPAFPGTVKAQFQTKPWGPLGDWQTVTKYIKL